MASEEIGKWVLERVRTIIEVDADNVVYPQFGPPNLKLMKGAHG